MIRKVKLFFAHNLTEFIGTKGYVLYRKMIKIQILFPCFHEKRLTTKSQAEKCIKGPKSKETILKMFKKINIISEEIFKNTCNKFQLFNNIEIPELHMFGSKSDVSSSTFFTWYAGF